MDCWIRQRLPCQESWRVEDETEKSIIRSFVQVPQLSGLLDDGRHQHFGQDLIAGKLGVKG